MGLIIYKAVVILVITLFSSINLFGKTDCENSIQNVNSLLADSLSRRGDSWLSLASITMYEEFLQEVTNNNNCFAGEPISVLESGIKILLKKQNTDKNSSYYMTRIHVFNNEGGLDNYDFESFIDELERK